MLMNNMLKYKNNIHKYYALNIFFLVILLQKLNICPRSRLLYLVDTYVHSTVASAIYVTIYISDGHDSTRLLQLQTEIKLD